MPFTTSLSCMTRIEGKALVIKWRSIFKALDFRQWLVRQLKGCLSVIFMLDIAQDLLKIVLNMVQCD